MDLGQLVKLGGRHEAEITIACLTYIIYVVLQMWRTTLTCGRLLRRMVIFGRH
jgi:hypothetical protein